MFDCNYWFSNLADSRSAAKAAWLIINDEQRHVTCELRFQAKGKARQTKHKICKRHALHFLSVFFPLFFFFYINFLAHFLDMKEHYTDHAPLVFPLIDTMCGRHIVIAIHSSISLIIETLDLYRLYSTYIN